MSRIVIIILSVSIIAFFIAMAFVLPQKTTGRNSNQQVQTKQQDVVVSRSADGQGTIISSAKYHFTQELQSEFSYHVDESSHSASLTLWFSRPNTNASEGHTRNTPNGFNTAAEDTWSLSVFRNDAHFLSSDVRAFQSWRSLTNLGDQSDPTTTVETDLGQIIRIIQADGVGSHGYYYYFIRPNYVYVFGSGDFSDTEMLAFIAGFQLQN